MPEDPDTPATGQRAAVLVDPRILAEMVELLLRRRGVEVVDAHRGAPDLVVVSPGRSGEVALGPTVVVLAFGDRAPAADVGSTIAADLGTLLDTVTARPTG